MARSRSGKFSKRAALAATSTLLLLLFLKATNSNNRALLSTGHGKSHPPVSVSPQGALAATQAAAGRGDGGGGGTREEWPESWGREIGFRPGISLPNLGRTEAEGVQPDSGARSPFYGDLQRRHQAWLLRRADEVRSGNNAGGGGGGNGDGIGGDAVSSGATAGQKVDEERPSGEREQGREGNGGQAAGTGYEGDSADTVDSEDWTKIESRARAVEDPGAESGSVEKAGGGVPETAANNAAHSAGAAAGGGASSNPEPGTRRRLSRHQKEGPRGRQRQRQRHRQRQPRQAGLGASNDGESNVEGGNAAAAAAANPVTRRLTARGWGWGWGWSGHAAESNASIRNKERVRRLERGAELWGGTYAPPIEPQRRQGLVDKWSSSPWGEGRILYVITSFDRGERLGRDYKQIDKLDYILMMMDEMREACELGFSPQVHLIAAWDPSEVAALVEDRLFCQRTGMRVPYSHEEHPPSVRNNLAIKHRIYMKQRVQDFDVFLQVEDDMILTLNHILLYKEECEYLENRKGMGGSRGKPNVFVPGFMRVEPDGDDWVEWEIALSRFSPIKIFGAGVYMALRPSRVLPRGGNNQGMWMATREQLAKMAHAEGCRYLAFDNSSTNGMPETHSGSIQMFHSECGFEKVFPTTHFEDFIVHHRTNTKNGRRGESIPGVSMTMLRVWAEQFIRDENFLNVRHWSLPAQR